MNGYEVYETAMILLGYTDADGELQGGDGLSKRALDAVNQIGADLCLMMPLNSLDERLNIPPRALEAMPAGVAMLLALSDGDGDRNRLFCELYNAKRAAAKAGIQQIRDVLPTAEGV